jgi:hypothetical protein
MELFRQPKVEQATINALLTLTVASTRVSTKYICVEVNRYYFLVSIVGAALFEPRFI